MATKLIVIYIAAVCVISVILTVYDKTASKRGWQRTRESTLLWFGFLGGAIVMLPTMKWIRHKTQKKKFMVRLPLFLAMHILLLALYFYMEYGV